MAGREGGRAEGDFEIVCDYLWDRAFARAVDRLSSERFKIPDLVLMEHAGRGVAEAILDADAADVPIVVLAGLGNNGGDALVAARWLHEAGADVHVFLVTRKTDAQPSALCAQQLQILKALGMATPVWRPGALARFRKAEPVIIDGVLGLGFEGRLEPDSPVFKALAEAAEIPEATVVAVDVPSGLDADSGDAQELPLEADVTITFGGKKPAHVLAPARDLCGEVLALACGFPNAAQDAALERHQPGIVQPDPRALLGLDPWAELPPSAHKYDRGHVLVIGGSAGKTGAPLMAATAALRAGAGWATVAMPQSAMASLHGEVPKELVFEALFDGERLDPLKLERFIKERKVRAVVVGPGAVVNPLDSDVMAVLAAASSDDDLFVLCDAGATHKLAGLLKDQDLPPEKWLLTPHPGEWRQLGEAFDRSPLTPAGLEKATRLAADLGVALLYKHATPLLISGSPDMPAFVVAEGTVALARAGSGDVLAGVAGAHGAIGLTSVVAALRAQIQVAWAARLAAEEKGEQAVLARDIFEQLGNVAELAEEEDEDDEDFVGEDDGDDEPMH